MKFKDWLLAESSDIRAVADAVARFYAGGLPDQMMVNTVYNHLTQHADRSNVISGLLKTDPQKYQQYNGPYKQILGELTRVLAAAGWTPEDNGAWIQWYRKGNTGKGVKTGGVTSKRYVSIDGNDVWDVMRSLSKLARRLDAVKTDPRSDVIGFKVPMNFGSMFGHRDNIVIHFYDAAAKPQIDQAVTSFMAEIGKKEADRTAMDRVSFGQDRGGSDSDLVAQQVVRNLRANQKVIQPLLTSDPAQAGQILQKMIRDISMTASHRVPQ